MSYNAGEGIEEDERTHLSIEIKILPQYDFHYLLIYFFRQKVLETQSSRLIWWERERERESCDAIREYI